MREVLFMALKDLRILSRDKFAVFWILGFPLIYALFFGSIFGRDSGGASAMSVAIVDDAKNDASRALIARLAESDALRVRRDESGAPRTVDLETATRLVRKGDRVALIRILPGLRGGGFAVFARDGGDDALIEVGVDPTRSAERGYLQGVLMENVFGGLSETFRSPDAMRRETRDMLAQIRTETDMPASTRSALETLFGSLDDLADANEANPRPAGGDGSAGDPFANIVRAIDVAPDTRGRPRSSFNVMFPSAILWGLIGCLSGFAISIVRERIRGTLVRLRVAPVSIAQVLAGKALACWLACVLVCIVLLVIGNLAFGVRIGNVAMLAAAIACTAACFTGIMMVVSVIGRTEEAVAGAGWGIMMPLAMIGGAMIPLIAMPQWVLALSDFSPVKWGIYAIEGAVWRDLTFGEVFPALAILLGIGVAAFAAGVVIFRRQHA